MGKTAFYTAVAQIVPILFVVYAFEQKQISRAFKKSIGLEALFLPLAAFVVAETLSIYALYTGEATPVMDSFIFLSLWLIGFFVLFHIAAEVFEKRYGKKDRKTENLYTIGAYTLFLGGVYVLFSFQITASLGFAAGLLLGRVLPRWLAKLHISIRNLKRKLFR